ncbi:MAG: DNA repair protein RecO [Hyphomicrobiales bacterium]|nr:MAG: DNA repair protein RecO [Hyphomicrobiales bacterium]
MEWSDEGVVLATRRHGETSVILEVMTVSHGRHLGLVRGGRSRRHQPTLQPGNSLLLSWRARLDEHLGTFTVESKTERAARLMETPLGIHLVQALAGHLRLLPERDPHERLFRMAEAILDHGEALGLAAALLVRFELALLEELGFGLDLSCCVATGATADLVYVSPKSGRAVSREAGQPYADRMLALPPFLLGSDAGEVPEPSALANGLALTEYFLSRDVFVPRGIQPPRERQWIVERLGQGV